MRIEQILYSILQPVFNGELYPVRHPDPDGKMSSVSDTFGIYLKTGGNSYNNLDGDMGLNRVRVQVSIYSIDYDELKEKESAVNIAMQSANQIANTTGPFSEGALQNVSTTVPTDGYEADTKRFYIHMEFYCWERPDGITETVVLGSYNSDAVADNSNMYVGGSAPDNAPDGTVWIDTTGL